MAKHRFQKGGPPGPGRPKGALSKVTEDVRALSRRLVEDPAYVASLTQRLQDGKAPHMEPVLFAYAYGKPKETTEHTGRIRITWES